MEAAPRALRNPDQLRAKGASIPGIGRPLPEVIGKQLTEFVLGQGAINGFYAFSLLAGL